MGGVKPYHGTQNGNDRIVNGVGGGERARGREKRESSGGGGGGNEGSSSGGASKKPLMCRGREVRTVEEAAALDCTRSW